MPDPALPRPNTPVRNNPSGQAGSVLLRCPRGARVAPSGEAGDQFCSICDCGRRTDTTVTREED